MSAIRQYAYKRTILSVRSALNLLIGSTQAGATMFDSCGITLCNVQEPVIRPTIDQERATYIQLMSSNVMVSVSPENPWASKVLTAWRVRNCCSSRARVSSARVGWLASLVTISWWSGELFVGNNIQPIPLIEYRVVSFQVSMG